MIEQQARIVQVKEGQAWVSVGPQGGCSACDAGQGCGAGLFSKLLRRKPLILALPNPAGHKVGQPVLLGISELFYLRLVLRLYAAPLVAGLAGAWICHQIGESSGLSRGHTDLLSLAGLLAGAWLLLLRQSGAPGATEVEQHIEMKAARGPAGCLGAESASGFKES